MARSMENFDANLSDLEDLVIFSNLMSVLDFGSRTKDNLGAGPVGQV